MKKLQITALALALLVTAGCAGRQARDKALWPAIEGAWPGVRKDAERGGADEELVTDFDTAVAGRDAVTVKLRYPAVEEAAMAGIEARDTSEPIERILVERVTKLRDAVELLR